MRRRIPSFARGTIRYPLNITSRRLAIELGNDMSDEGSLEECLCKLNNVIDEGDDFVSPFNLGQYKGGRESLLG